MKREAQNSLDILYKIRMYSSSDEHGSLAF